MTMNSVLTGLIPIHLLLFSLWGCSEAYKNEIPDEIAALENLIEIPADIQPTHEITVQKDRVFGEFPMRGGGFVGSIGDIAVDDSNRVFVADLRQNTIRVIAPDGQPVKRLGREGSGPGEFGHIFDMKIQGNMLFAFDPSLFRVNFYSLEALEFDHVQGLFIQDWADNPKIRGSSLIKFFDWGNNNMLIGFKQNMGPETYYYIVNNSNHRTEIVSDPILIQRNEEYAWLEVELPNGMIGSSRVPFGRESLIAVTEERHILTVWTELFLIKEYDPEGTYLQSWYYPYQNQPLTQEAIDSVVNPDGEAYIERAIREYDAPATWPALHDMKVDDQNRLWISTVVEDPSVTEWWILEKDGTLLARFNWPREKNIEAVKNNFFYTKETYLEAGEQVVARYRIEMTKTE